MIELLLLNLAPALFLGGIAWFLEIVQLPLLAGGVHFSRYISAHRRRNTFLMAVPMAVEMISAILLWRDSRRALVLILLGLVGAIWLATFVGIVPGFHRLTSRYDRTEVNRLIAWNGVRVACWTARSAILLYIVAKGIRI